MRGLLVDSNVLLDIFEDDPQWAQWSEEMLDQLSLTHVLCINPIIYSEISVGFERIEQLESSVAACGLRMLPHPQSSSLPGRQGVR